MREEHRLANLPLPASHALLEALVLQVYGVALPSSSVLAGAVEALGELLRASHAAWPTIDPSDTTFVEQIGAMLPRRPERLADALTALRGPELFLAHACARGDARAIAIFDKRYLADIPTAVARMRMSGAAIDDLTQVVRRKLLLGVDGAPPKISEFAGRGTLDSWVRVVAVREALTSLRRRASDVPIAGDEVMSTPTTADDPELALVRARYADDFNRAFRAAVEALASDERTILRLHFVDGLSVEQVGSIYRVHRSTVARWIATSRRTLLDEVRRMLAGKLRLTPQEFDSLVLVLRSDLEISLERLLAPEE